MRRAVLLFASIALSVAAAEVSARKLGYAPAAAPDVTVQPWAQFDSELIWINRSNVQIQWGAEAATFGPDGSRATRPASLNRDDADLVLVLGCSYTQGLGVADADTFAWKLQQRFPTFDVTNFGTGGYGTYQSLLRFRRLVRSGRIPRLVIFGFASFHGVRDRGTRAWLVGNGNARSFLPPHVGLANGRLVEYPGARFPVSWLAHHSASWNLVERTYREQIAFAPDNDTETLEVHRAILLQLQREIEDAGSTLLVANLWVMPPDRPAWRQFFRDNAFHFADCVPENAPFAHPDAFWHLLHADCIERAIRREGLLDE